MPGLIERFAQYAIAFEEVFIDDRWERLEPFFTADAEHVVTGGGPLAVHSKGRASVISDLRQSVDACDRRFDRRLPEIIAGPEERDGAVWMAWRLTLQRDGAPDLRIEGDHLAVYRGDALVRIEETLGPEVGPALEAYVAAYGDRLHPYGGRRAETVGAPENDALSPARMRTVVEEYARAKSRADVDGALACCHDDFVLETVSFGLASHGKAETALHLHAFFHSFPDYAVTLDELTFGDASVACWGTARMTMRGDILDVRATGRTAELPIFCAFRFRDGLLASERFFFDLVTLTEGIGVPLATMQRALGAVGEGEPRAAAAG
jgi:ketosteroid isomerase-like protein